MTMRLLRSSVHRVMPWKNGGGTTTEIARFPEGASLDDFAWRVSLARVEGAGPFSPFAGVDRTIALVVGPGMTLALAGRGEVAIDAATPPFAFPGDVAVSASLAGGPVEDFNAMTRRSRFRHWVTRTRVDRPARFTALGDLAVIFLARGDAGVLGPRDAAVLEHAGSIDLTPATESELLVVDLWRA